MDGLGLDTTVYDIASRFGSKLSEIIGGDYRIKALGHHVEVSAGVSSYIDLYPRGRYILMRVSGNKRASGLLRYWPTKLSEGSTRYLIIVPGVEFVKPPDRYVGRLNVFGYVEYRGNYYLIAAHKSHIIIALETLEKHIKELQDDAVFYGMIDTSGRTPSFVVRPIKKRKDLIKLAEKEFGITPYGVLECGGAGTVSAIMLAYAHKEILGLERNKLLRRFVEHGNIRIAKRRK